MRNPSESAREFQNGVNLTPPEINALLFYRLGQFVVWGRQHHELAASDADLSRLLDSAAYALSRGGIREGGLAPEGAAAECGL